MSPDILEARRYIAEAREALQRGDKEAAWQLGKRAALIAPEMEDAWLVLAASDSDPQKALAYAQEALKINPASPRARRGLEWARARVEKHGTGNVSVKQGVSLGLPMGQQGAIASLPRSVSSVSIPTPPLKIKSNVRNRLYLAFLIGAGCLTVGFVAFFAWANPALASIVNNIRTPGSTQENLWAPVDIAKATVTPIDVSKFAPDVDTLANQSPATSTSVPTDMPTLVASEAPTATPEVTDTPGAMVMEIVGDAPVPTNEALVQYPAGGNGQRWIDVNLSEQRVYVYDGDVVVNSFLASTGLPGTPTVTGKYRIWIKVRIQDMSGPGYYLRDVPWVMYFYEDYGFHGTYWHNNFGTPMSRGCVNLTIDDAAWLYNWASVGTVVNIHY